jgi:hypothetical protein
MRPRSSEICSEHSRLPPLPMKTHDDMTNAKVFILALALILTPVAATAGSARGLQIVVVSTPSGQAYLPTVKSFFDRYDPDGGESECDGALLNIDTAIMGTGAHGISSDLAISALSNERKRKQLATLLAAYRHKRAPRGLDGVLAVDSTEGELRLYGISAFLPAGTQQSRIRSDELANQTKFNTAVCHALIHMPVMEEP